MIPFILPGAQICQLDQRGYASQKNSIVSVTGTDLVALPLIGEGFHVKILFSLRPIVAPVHTVLVAFDQLGVKIQVLTPINDITNFLIRAKLAYSNHPGTGAAND